MAKSMLLFFLFAHIAEAQGASCLAEGEPCCAHRVMSSCSLQNTCDEDCCSSEVHDCGRPGEGQACLCGPHKAACGDCKGCLWHDGCNNAAEGATKEKCEAHHGKWCEGNESLSNSTHATSLAEATNSTKAQDGLIYLIRHGEKDSHGCESATGLKRAANLYDVFKTKFSLPSYVFAYKYDGECQRCKQTVDPIADKLGLSVDFTHGARDCEEEWGKCKGFANAIKNEALKGKTVLVASEHNHIQYVANSIGVPKNEIPHWHGSDYDSVYIVTLSGDKASLVHKHQTKDVSEVVV